MKTKGQLQYRPFPVQLPNPNKANLTTDLPNDNSLTTANKDTQHYIVTLQQL